MISMRSAFAPMLAIALLTTACHKAQAPEQPANDANVAQTEPAPPPPPPPEPVVQPEAKPARQKTAVAPPDEHKLSDDEQMREDAEATGMTSRLQPAGDAAQNSTDSAGGNSSQH